MNKPPDNLPILQGVRELLDSPKQWTTNVMNNAEKIRVLTLARCMVENDEQRLTCLAICRVCEGGILDTTGQRVRIDIEQYLQGAGSVETYLENINKAYPSAIEAKAARLQMIDDILMLYELSDEPI
jgi:hypothetical protein